LKEFFEKHGVRILAVAASVAVLLSVLSFFASTSSFLQNAAGVVTAPFRAVGEAVSGWVEDKTHYYKDYSDLLEENEELRREVAELRANARQAEKDRSENALLRALLELRKQKRDLQLESAMILDRSESNWTSTLTLNRGTAHDVAVNDCVISAEGYLIGVVSEVGYNWCTVLNLIDTNAEFGAMVFRTGDLAIAEGDFALMGEGRLKLSYLPPTLSLLVGDYIVTSGLGGYYPSDLVIGTVSSVATDDNGLAQYAVLSPMVDYDTLTEVFIIKDFEIVD
jgi:rod shape-determining protein MreC